jgi:hypothetical protein
VQEQRIAERKAYEETRVADLKAIVDVANRSTAVYEAMAHATQDRTRATDAVAAAQKATAESLERLAGALKETQDRITHATKETLDRIEEIDRQQDRVMNQAEHCQQGMERLIQSVEALRGRRGG